MRFEDVDTDGITVDADADDRVLFHTIETRNEVGDLPVEEAWMILADRYPNDARLRILAWYADLHANGVDATRDAAVVARALKHMIDTFGPSPEVAALVAMASVEIGDRERDALVPLEKIVAPLPEERIARRTLRKLASAVLDEAEDKTRDGRPFGVRVEPASKVVATGAIKKYSPATEFTVGDRVDHPKFGEGLVLSKAEGKIEVAFPDERRRLVAK
jgi:hypothetical protein